MLGRINGIRSTLEKAASAQGLDWKMLAALTVVESLGGARVTETTGTKGGRGWFQIDITRNPTVSEQQAYDLAFAADWTAKELKANASFISKNIQDLSAETLLWMTISSHNTGAQGQVNRYNAGNGPDWQTQPRGDGTYGNAFGKSILGLMDCF